MSCSGTFGFGFGRDIHHGGSALGIVVRKGFHFYLSITRISSPADQASRSSSATRKALARVMDGMSPEPFQATSSTVDPSSLKKAGRNLVRPGLWRKSLVRR